MRLCAFTAVFAMLSIGAARAPAQAVAWRPFQLPFGDGTVDAELATITVPENHAEPGGSKVDLAVVRLPGTGDRSKPPTVYLDGGPGGSAIGIARLNYFAGIFTKLRDIGDVILIDQRGVGRSRPNLACARTSPPADLFESEEKFRGYLLQAARTCADQHRARGVRLEHYHSDASANDLAAVLRTLGVPKVNLLGFSYGTHLGLATIRRHPDLIARAVLAGVEGPDHSEKFPSILDIQLQRLAAYARADSTIGSLVPDLVAMHRRNLQRLERDPARLTLNDPVTRQPTEVRVGKFGYQFILMRDMGDTNDWPILPGLIARTAAGDYGLLTQFAARRWSTGVSAMSIAMDCASGASPERGAMVQREALEALFGNAMNYYTGEICAASGATDLGAEYRSRIWSAVPTLFISGTLDAQTPPHQAEEVRWGFANAVHVIVENAGHESMLDKAPVQELLVRFLNGEAVADQRIVLPRPKFRDPEE